MVYNDSFAWTPALVNLSNQLWEVTAIVGAALCGAVLIGIGILAMNPVSRPHLDRVSFRILVLALAANTVFGVTNAIGGKFTGPTWTCGLDIWLLQLTLELSSFLLFSIALNLQLVVVHRVNGQQMEKWYIWGSIILALALTVPPYALKQYGWDPLIEECWYSNDDRKQRLGWQIGTQLFWSLLAVAGEIVCTTAVLVYIFKPQLRKNQIRAAGTGSRMTRPRSGSVVVVKNQVTHANAYRGVILRIVAYPVASALFNLISVVCAIHGTQNDGVHTWVDYRLLLLSDFTYGGRSILYALLTATDPALVRAAKAFFQHGRGLHPSPISGAQNTFRGRDSKANISVQIELATIRQNDDGTITGANGVLTKPATSALGFPHGYSDHFDSILKPLSDIEEAPLDNAILGTPGNLQERSRLRGTEDRVRRQKELEAFSKERQAFQRQI
ncbi:hypothetical protein K438DRAFT_776011 [Mycena galopus ATCC 62051]|nr:hypothetical protein K438DRAFT_776011 [Mycena galopus ATCC 62051]